MHHKTLKSAVEKYLPMVADGTNIIELMEADEKGYSKEDIEEIMSAIADASQAKAPAKIQGKSSSLNTLYEEWKVKAVVSHKLNQETGDKDRIVKFEKDAQSLIRTTSITADKAEILNSQSENTLLRLYEVK